MKSQEIRKTIWCDYVTGLEWIREAGVLTTPIAITNTHSVGVVRDALIRVELRGNHLLGERVAAFYRANQERIDATGTLDFKTDGAATSEELHRAILVTQDIFSQVISTSKWINRVKGTLFR